MDAYRSAAETVKQRDRANSFTNFSKSIKRAAWFKEIQPTFKSILLQGDESEESQHRDEEQGWDREGQSGQAGGSQSRAPSHSQHEGTGLLNGSNSQSYGTLTSKLNGAAKERAEGLAKKRKESSADNKDEHREALTTRKMIRDDGTEAEVIIGQSTLPQTIFNGSNVLIGVGLLSLPLGLKYAGWVIGLVLLFFFGYVNKYSANVMAKCMDVDRSLANFSDIAYVAYGEKGRMVTSTLFILELAALCVSLIVLFADSMHSLIPQVDTLHWKMICGLILIPSNFMSMRLLSYASFVGIFAMNSILVLVIVDGCLKADAPGSLRSPMPTHAFPQSWRQLPLAFGLIMAPFGGQSVFCNIYRDMRHPWRYETGLRVVFSYTAFMNAAIAIIGYIMFGNEVEDSLATSILVTPGYPYWIKIVVLVLVAIIPLMKFSLCCAPMISTLEVFTKIDPRAASIEPNWINQSRFWTLTLKASFRLGTVVILTILAIAIPTFELISAIMGSLFCYSICVILPMSFHLKMFGRDLGFWNIVWDAFLIAFGISLGLVGFIFEFLPEGFIGPR